MKKLLLAGTAIAGLAMAATPAHAEIDLDVGGYFKGYLGFVDQDNDTGLHDFDWKRESEIHFKGETTLDNGLTVGVNVEIEGEEDTGADNQIEENYIYFSGNWGRVNLGAEDGAAYLLQVAAPSADDNVDGMDPDFMFINTNDLSGIDNLEVAYEQSFSQDADKITYLTPKFNGFQAGVSYKPTEVEEGSAAIGDSLAGMPDDDEDGAALDDDYKDLVEVAFRYDGEFEGVGIAFGAGYTTAAQELEQATEDDYKEYNVGLTLSFDAFSLGAVYTEDNNGLDDNNDDEIWVIGADYTYGPYKFGASYLNSQFENGAATEDELDRYSVGAQYVYGPGMSFRGSVNVYEIDGAGTGATEDRDAVSVLVGTDISF